MLGPYTEHWHWHWHCSGVTHALDSIILLTQSSVIVHVCEIFAFAVRVRALHINVEVWNACSV
jgi:hypothetical protein